MQVLTGLYHSHLSPQTLGTHSVKIRVDDEIESEHAAEVDAPVAAASAADDEESAAKGASKKQEVKLQVLVTRR